MEPYEFLPPPRFLNAPSWKSYVDVSFTLRNKIISSKYMNRLLQDKKDKERKRERESLPFRLFISSLSSLRFYKYAASKSLWPMITHLEANRKVSLTSANWVRILCLSFPVYLCLWKLRFLQVRLKFKFMIVIKFKTTKSASLNERDFSLFLRYTEIISFEVFIC